MIPSSACAWLREKKQKAITLQLSAFTIIKNQWKRALPYLKKAIRYMLRNPITFWVLRKALSWGVEEVDCHLMAA